MYLVTNIKDNSLPVGGAQHAIGFIDKILPAHRDRVRNLKPGERVSVTFCPLASDVGYQVEVYRTKEGSEPHDAEFNESLKMIKQGVEVTGDLGDFPGTDRQRKIIERECAVQEQRA